jgi:glycine/D-amino acid oxidase-like deaminating enzyme
MDFRTTTFNTAETGSYWGSASPEFRPALTRDVHADVAVIGAGYTGLWTAYYLLERDPHLRVAVLEAEHAGFGASGRNGGWCSALFPVSLAALAREHGRDAAIAQYRAMQASVREIGRVVEAESIDCDWALGGTTVLARSKPQLARAEAEFAESASFGFGVEDVSMLDADQAREHVNATGVVGGIYTPHCAAIHPRKLVRSLADVVTARGAAVYEHSRVVSVEPGRVRTKAAAVRADVIVRATEGYTANLPGHERDLAPVYSLMIATEPLSAAVWEEIGLSRRQTFADERHLIVYGQRTADGRLVFGGRGAPYHFRSRIDPSFDQVPAVFAGLRRSLVELFPVLADTAITHAWGGPLGVARDWHASVGLDRGSGMGWAGGYVGDGVSTTNLAGRTLADLITGSESALTRLPWVGHISRRWEPEPLRWFGANAALRAMQWADASEARRGRPSLAAAVVEKVLGR